MIVSLSECRTVSAPFSGTLAVCLEDGGVEFRRRLLDPREQRGAEIKTDPRVIIDYFHDAIPCVQNARSGIARIALRGDALVPVMIRVSGVLQLDCFEPWMLARGLIKVAVNANVVHRLSVIARVKTTKALAPTVTLCS